VIANVEIHYLRLSRARIPRRWRKLVGRKHRFLTTRISRFDSAPFRIRRALKYGRNCARNERDLREM